MTAGVTGGGSGTLAGVGEPSAELQARVLDAAFGDWTQDETGTIWAYVGDEVRQFKALTTYEGMGRLIEAMQSQKPKWHYQFNTYLDMDGASAYFWRAANESGRWSARRDAPKLPDAVLLAAAAALGVEGEGEA